jgi:tetratricopeptide (TPR) repeat protein
MRHHPLRDQTLSATVLVGATLACLLVAASADAAVQTITATGEYRMGDNDTKTDAKRLALLDAKRLALEKTGTYLEGVTEVKNLQVTRDEIKTYTAGIVEVLEQETKTIHEGETTVVRVDVTVKIDTAAVAKQIEALRKHEHAREELEQARAEADQLRQEVEAKTKEIAALKSKSGAEPLLKEREQMLARLDSTALVAQAWRAPIGMREDRPALDTTNPQELARTKAMLKEALALDPSNARAHFTLGHILQAEGYVEEAIREYREAIRLRPDKPRAHAELGRALLKAGRREEAKQELQLFLQTAPPTPENQRLIEKVRAKLHELQGSHKRPPGPRRKPRENAR